MTVEGLMGSHRPFLAAIHRIRGHEGQARVAADLRALLAGSEINAAHQDELCDKVQDPYSLRCAPQVHGAARDALAFIRRTLAVEANAATDNPLVFAEDLEDVPAGTIVRLTGPDRVETASWSSETFSSRLRARGRPGSEIFHK